LTDGRTDGVQHLMRGGIEDHTFKHVPISSERKVYDVCDRQIDRQISQNEAFLAETKAKLKILSLTEIRPLFSLAQAAPTMQVYGLHHHNSVPKQIYNIDKR